MDRDQNHTEHNQAQHNQNGATEPDPAIEAMELDAVSARKGDARATAVTIVVVGVGAALISVELLAGVLIGVAASFLPGIGRHVRPLLRSTVKAGSVAARKTREFVAEKSGQVRVLKARASLEAVSPAPVPPMPEAAAPAESQTSPGM